jgi:TonB family protein
MLVGKTLYLRGGYLGDSLTFNEHGGLSGHSAQGSYALSLIEIDRVRLAKHKVEIEGIRYGLHFLGELPYEDPANAVDKVRITPKKKIVKITIDRELVVKPKKPKEEKPAKGAGGKPAKDEEAKPSPAAAKPAATAANPATDAADSSPPAAATDAANAATTGTTELTDEEEAKKEMATAPEEERPADPNSVTTTLSPAHASQVLRDALDKIFAPGLDDGIKAAMPDFWKLYYQAVAAKADYRPSDPSVMRQSAVDKKARLLTSFEPDSNQFAQDNGIAGMALYHVIVEPDGKPGEIAVARPIGFGLDENAVAAIRKAQFEPAVKDGKPVPVLLDLVVQFRIYSKRTNVVAPPEASNEPAEPKLPGPYSVHQPQ